MGWQPGWARLDKKKKNHFAKSAARLGNFF
jgi:hypothetical protein